MSEASLAAKVLLDSFGHTAMGAHVGVSSGEAVSGPTFEGAPENSISRAGIIALEPAPNYAGAYGPENQGEAIPIGMNRPDHALISQVSQLREQFGHLFPDQLPVPKRNRENPEGWTPETIDDFGVRAKMWQEAVEKSSGGHMRVSFTDNPSGVPEVRTRCDTCGDVVRTRARFFVRDAVFDHLVSSKHISSVSAPRGPSVMLTVPTNGAAAAAYVSESGAHEGPCSAMCLGFGFRDNLVRGPDYRNKEKRLLFVIDPDFRGRRCPCNGGQVAEDGSAFGRSEFQCLGVAHNPSGVCDGCERASKLHVARQRRYYRCNRLDVCGRRSNVRKRKHEGGESTRTRRTNAPAGSEAARRHAPGYVLGTVKAGENEEESVDTKPVAGPQLGPQVQDLPQQIAEPPAISEPIHGPLPA